MGKCLNCERVIAGDDTDRSFCSDSCRSFYLLSKVAEEFKKDGAVSTKGLNDALYECRRIALNKKRSKEIITLSHDVTPEATAIMEIIPETVKKELQSIKVEDSTKYLKKHKKALIDCPIFNARVLKSFCGKRSQCADCEKNKRNKKLDKVSE